MTEDTIRTFGWVDYAVFFASLLLSAGIGIFYAIKDCLRKRKAKKENVVRQDSELTRQLLGGRNMKPLPVAMSQLASFLSAPFMLGNPTEIYMFGTMYAAILVAYPIAAVVTSLLFVPVFHRQEIASSYEFIEKRFNKKVRWICSVMFTIGMTLMMGVVIFAPGAAFAQVTGLDPFMSILGVGVICTFYTVMGGMKAVVWTDVLQMIIMLAGLVALLAEGLRDVGGVSIAWERVVKGGRIHFDKISPDPTVRHTWWTQVIGGLFLAMSITATNQSMIQRYLCVKTTRDAQLSVVYAAILLEFYLLFVFCLGGVMYAFYYGCDPLVSKRILTKDQLVPIFVMDCLGDWYGLPGLFTAAVFSASCSTVSSGVNSLAAVVIHDFIHPAYERIKHSLMSDRVSGVLSKVIALVFGVISVILAFLAPFFGTTLIQLSNSVLGLTGGPLLGLFSLAIFFPCANSWGAAAGTIVSLGITGWIVVGTFLNPNMPSTLPLETDRCPFNLSSEAEGKIALADDSSGYSIGDMYKISYMWYSMISSLIALGVGLIVSLLTGGNRGKYVDWTQIFKYDRRCKCCMPCCSAAICGIKVEPQHEDKTGKETEKDVWVHEVSSQQDGGNDGSIPDDVPSYNQAVFTIGDRGDTPVVLDDGDSTGPLRSFGVGSIVNPAFTPDEDVTVPAGRDPSPTATESQGHWRQGLGYTFTDEEILNTWL